MMANRLSKEHLGVIEGDPSVEDVSKLLDHIAALEAENERLRVTVADMYDESDVDALQHRINTLRAEIERLADTLETYRQFVRDIVTGGFVKGEVALSRGIATLESDPANDEWWSELQEQALQRPNSLLAQWRATRASTVPSQETGHPSDNTAY